MDTNNGGQMPATDDQELAKVLAGMNQQAAAAAPIDPASDGLQYEESGLPPVPGIEETSVAEATSIEQPVEGAPTQPEATPESAEPIFTEHSQPEPPSVPVAEPATVSANPELDSLKKDALDQLRPLVDRLELPAQEKFDTLLLIIRSTDDQSLLAAANEAAKLIEDETKRAEALLDIIKEIDFFTHQSA